MPSWEITNDKLELLDKVDGVKPGSLRLTTSKLEPAAADRVVAFVKKHGRLLSAFFFDPKWRLERWDFGDFDFAKECPEIGELTLGRCLVHPSVFAHPALVDVDLRESKVVGEKEIKIGTVAEGNDGKKLESVSITDSFTAKKIFFGPHSKIHRISWSIDEDCSDATPNDFVCDDCKMLRKIHIHACGSWTLDLRGTLPELMSTSFDATHYCRYSLVTTGLKPDSSADALAIKPGTFGGDESEE